MPRRVRLPTAEKGTLEVLVVRSKGGTWEGDWEALKGTPVGRSFSVVKQADFDHVLNGLSKPFVDALGLPPEGALRKLPTKQCARRDRCTLHDGKRCVTDSKKGLPWCFELAGLDLPPAAMTLATEVLFGWRSGVYVVVVEDG